MVEQCAENLAGVGVYLIGKLSEQPFSSTISSNLRKALPAHSCFMTSGSAPICLTGGGQPNLALQPVPVRLLAHVQ